MSTTTIHQPDVVANLPEWRRICHIYILDLERSICGTATWPGRVGEGHDDAECEARGHALCIVCDEVWKEISTT